MASEPIDNRVLRDSSFPDLAKYFKQLSVRASQKSITDHLLHGLATDAVPLRVVGVWIAGFADAPSIVKALHCAESKGVRRLAIRRFGRCLRKEDQMMALREAVGDIPGMLRLFNELSVHDVQSFCHVLGRTSSFNVAKAARQQMLTELCMGLVSDHFPQSLFQNPERRSLVKFYANIVPACTADFVRAWEGIDALPRAGGRWMEHAHYELVRERCMRQMRADHGETFQIARFKGIFHELPPLQVHKHMSQSMLFSLESLQYLGAHKEIVLSSVTISNDLADPLLRRLSRRRAPLALRAHAVETIVEALATRMKDSTLDLASSQLGSQAIECWERNNQLYESNLIKVLHLVPPTQQASLETIRSLIALATGKESRYSLLVLLFKHLAPFARDLENDNDIKDFGPWPWTFFALLPSERSCALLQRLIRIREKDFWDGNLFTILDAQHATSVLKELLRLRPSGDFINWQSLQQSHALFSKTHSHDDIALLQLYISRGSPETERRWQNFIDERKKESSRARDQDVRAMWARSAIVCSAASGSLDCYEDTLLWARKFNRDPLTVSSLYSSDTVSTSDGVALLSGIPFGEDKSAPTSDQVLRAIQRGNSVMMLLLETAFQGLREPSFQADDWRTVLGLFKEVTRRRLSRANELQAYLSLSEDQVYEMVWKPTSDMLMSAEQLCLQEEHEKLHAQEPDGILGFGNVVPLQIRHIRPSKCRFFDELAKRRDDLWRQRRRSLDPNVVSLQAPWPKGLSFHDSVSVRFLDEDKGYAGFLPFLMSRAEGIVFADPASVLNEPPKELHVRKAIGAFIDQYEDALRFYVDAGSDRVDKDRRRDLAWEHATGQLSQSRMSAVEASYFWANVFERAKVDVPDSRARMPIRPDPILPSVDDPKEPTEWNPDPEPERWVSEARELEVTCLDCMLEPHWAMYEASGRSLQLSTITTKAEARLAFWDDCHNRSMKSVSPAAREGLLAMGIMLINSKCLPGERLFSTPFPSPVDARFPAMFLDEEFMEREGVSEEHGFLILERLVRDAPLTLVAKLCSAMLDDLGRRDKPTPRLEQGALRLLKILVNSDRPRLALNLVREVVLERPDSSSWHRHLLTKGLFNGLMSAQARQFIQTLAVTCVEKLQLQAERKTAPVAGPAAPSSPIIKITTVTALAQLLSAATFVSGDEAVDMLVDVFVHSDHPDTRVAVLQSMTTILRKTRHARVKARILDAVEEHAIPIASSLNERSPMSEEDWARAETQLELPEVWDPHISSRAPVLSTLVVVYQKLSLDMAATMYQRILLPVLDASASNNKRWMRLFLRKHNLRCDAAILPPTPVKPCFLGDLISRDVQDRRENIFRIWGDLTLANLDPGPDLSEVNMYIANNRKLRASNGGKHWLSLWNKPGDAGLSIAGTQLHTFLSDPKRKNGGAVPIQLIQRIVMQQLEVFIMRSDESFAEQNRIINAGLARPPNKNEAWEMAWENNIRPLVQQVVDKIEGLRTPQWRRDRARRPVALRDTYDMRLWLLTYPGYDPSLLQKPDHGLKLARFASEVRAEVDRLAVRPLPYHENFARLKVAAARANPQDHCALALALGQQLPATSTLADYLRLEIAEALLTTATEPVAPAASLVQKVVEMVAGWRRSEDERVRMSGLRTVRLWEQQASGRTKWVHVVWAETERGR